MPPAKPWNHNIAYFPFIEKVARSQSRRSAIDVGTGDGMLAARLAEFIPIVVGLDVDEAQADAAAAAHPSVPGLRFETGDVLTKHPKEEPFDFVACSATIHHLDLMPALRRLRELTAPGGTLVIVGLATNSSALDWLIAAASAVPVRLARIGRGWHDHGAPRQDPRDSWTEVRRAVRAELPDSQWRRRFYWRYSVVWNRPSA
jgi:2-polyprenyl-3-methyl-5-hydroxy-6-metoxy-1,4-benzoquinol methylase